MTNQKTFLLCGLVAIALSVLFPPWLYTFYRTGTNDFSGSRSEKSAGYHFIFTPPAPEHDHTAHGIKLDSKALLLEWVCIGAITGAVLVLTAKREKKKDSKDN